MAYTAMYRKYRPLTFSDVVEQEHVVTALKNAVSSGRIAHAYLFCGTRGTGKTTLAKIFARAVNCLEPVGGDPCNKCAVCKSILNEEILDVIEIDAASNNGVENIRDIRNEVAYSPTMARYKVYIIDEVHMLSASAFNALLKTLEEPPAHAIFLLATTDPQKLPDTILSRCQRYDLRRISISSIATRLEYIAQDNGISIDRETSEYIADLADGALRDAIGILDRCYASGNEINADTVADTAGVISKSFIYDSAAKIVAGDIQGILEDVDAITREGRKISDYIENIMKAVRDLLVYKLSDQKVKYVDAKLNLFCKNSCDKLTTGRIVRILNRLSAAVGDIKWSSVPKVMLEAALAELCVPEESIQTSQMQSQAQPQSEVIETSFGVVTAERKKDEADRRIMTLENKLRDMMGRYEELALRVDNLAAQGVQNSSAKQYDEETAETKSLRQAAEAVEKVDLSQYSDYSKWNEVLAKLAEMKAMQMKVLYTGRTVLNIDDGIIAIVFKASEAEAMKCMKEKGNYDVLLRAVAAIEGKPLGVALVTDKGIKQKQADTMKEIEAARLLAESLNTELTVE